MEEGFEGLETMDLESAGADFDSVTQTSKTMTPDPSCSSTSGTLPVLSPIPSGIEVAQDNAPAAEQQPRESPAISPLPSCLNTPAPQSHPNSPPISAVGSRPITPQISTSSCYPDT
jgi:hypothetical protein